MGFANAVGFGYDRSTDGRYNGIVSFAQTLTRTGKQKKLGRIYCVYGKCGQFGRDIFASGDTLQQAWDHFKIAVNDRVRAERYAGLHVIKQGARTVVSTGRGW